MYRKQKWLNAANPAPEYLNPDCSPWHLSPDLLCESAGGDTDAVVIEEDDADFNWTNF